MKIRLYFDEDAVRHSLIRELRLRGVEVISALDAGMNGVPDDQQLAWAAAHGHALYSFNRGDFCRLHALWQREGRAHPGIVLSRQDLPLGEQMRRLLRLIHRLTPDEMQNRIEFLSHWKR